MIKKSGDLVLPGIHGKDILYDFRYNDAIKSQPVLIFAHGFKGFKDWGHFNLIADAFTQKGIAVLKFNFSHNGGLLNNPVDFPDLEAFGNNNYKIEVDEIKHVVDHVHNKKIAIPHFNGDIYLLGHSRGGGMSIIAASTHLQIKKLATWAAISDCMARLPNTAELHEWKQKGVLYVKNGRTKQIMPMYYQFVESLYKNADELNIEKACKKITQPFLVVHGSNDEAVNFNEGQALVRWNSGAKLVTVKEANHVFGGKHPFNDNILPNHSVEAVHETVKFLL